MNSLKKLFTEVERKKIITALETKDFSPLDKLIDNHPKKAKAIFNSLHSIKKLNELEQTLSHLDENIKNPEKISSDPLFSNLEIIIEKKQNFLKCLKGGEFLKALPRGWHKGREQEKKILNFENFSIFSDQDRFVFQRESWFKSLIIKESNSPNPLEIKENKNRGYRTYLEAGEYSVILDGKEFQLKLKNNF